MAANTSVSKNAFQTLYMQPFVDSLELLFSTHLHAEIQFGKLRLNNTKCTPYAISGIITFTGTVMGRAAISFPLDVAERLTMTFLNVDQLPAGMVEDCVGEMANTIVGRAKSRLDEHSISISTPTVIKGSDYAIVPQRDATCLSIPCKCKYGELQLDISMIDNALCNQTLK